MTKFEKRGSKEREEKMHVSTWVILFNNKLG